MKNIVLTGFMGTGKTEVGRILSRRLGYVLVDADAEIEKEQGITITEIFKQYGESKFREIEANIIKKLSEMKNAVISTGGGAVLRQENMDNLRKNGVIICLTASPETIFNRTSNNNDRPLLQVENPLQKIRELLEFRKPYYEKADIMIDTEGKSPIEVAEEIIEKVKTLCKQ
ncbi:shikimate kinase [Dissulfurispira thermophila]|uniref:Shikimate kinase n=2 Tax=root TaxID=1 RepID=A0A7G1H2W6_9BACT|nr:shikimate kinase [Dissulfurispira thermophila]BCB97140.1 shikimate kinase [Dissulfurispira thermophila]